MSRKIGKYTVAINKLYKPGENIPHFADLDIRDEKFFMTLENLTEDQFRTLGYMMLAQARDMHFSNRGKYEYRSTDQDQRVGEGSRDGRSSVN